MHFTPAFLVTVLASLASASVTLDLTSKCTDFGGISTWTCTSSTLAGVVCGSVYNGGGSYCSDCAKQSTPGLFTCSCAGNNCP